MPNLFAPHLFSFVDPTKGQSFVFVSNLQSLPPEHRSHLPHMTKSESRGGQLYIFYSEILSEIDASLLRLPNSILGVRQIFSAGIH